MATGKVASQPVQFKERMTFGGNLNVRMGLRSPCSLRVMIVSFVDALGLGCPSQQGRCEVCVMVLSVVH